MYSKKYTLWILFAMLLPIMANAEENKPTSIDDLYVNFTPGIMAFQILDETPTKVVDPGKTQEFVIALNNNLANQNFKSGFGIKWSPFTSFYNKLDSLEYWEFLLRSISLSFGTAGSKGGMRMAYGINLKLWDKTDLYFNEGYKTEPLCTKSA